jgi:hypothetical protein
MAVELFRNGGSSLFGPYEVSQMLANGWYLSPEDELKARTAKDEPEVKKEEPKTREAKPRTRKVVKKRKKRATK